MRSRSATSLAARRHESCRSACREISRDFGIAEVFQLIGQQRKTGVLELRSGDDPRRSSVRSRLGRVGGARRAAPATRSLGDMLVRCGQLTRERADERSQQRATSAQHVARTLVDRADGSTRAGREQLEDLVTRETLFERAALDRAARSDFRAQTVDARRDARASCSAPSRS